MARRDYVVEGAILECTLGTAPGEMIVTSQQKVKIGGKLKATSEDKIPKPPFFGSCTCSSPNPPCSPVFKEWQLASKRSTMGDKTFLMADSQIICEKGGLVTVSDVGQKLVGTGKKETELDEKYAELKGEIVFVNGYLSSSIGGALNALMDYSPDEPDPGLKRGHNMNEENKIDPDDILTADELAKINRMSAADHLAEKKSQPHLKLDYELKDALAPFPVMMSPGIPVLMPVAVKIPVKGETIISTPTDLKSVPEFTQQEIKNVFWGYWNGIGNNHRGSAAYAAYFNSENNEHFMNGSHGLDSNAAHRLDHGIAQGYHWAEHQWGIIPQKEVADTKESVPYIESHSPAYKPLTIVMHSQGNAPGVGFALGAMKYANELGWEKIPLNLIFLGIHQPQNLWEKEYDDFIKLKTKHYLADTDFWDTLSSIEKGIFMVGDKKVKGAVLLRQFFANKEDEDILKYLNGISELFSTEKNKLRNKRGITEHLKEITNFDAIKDRSVQFTFTNDRADIVFRDGDIPEMDNACNPNGDTTLFSVEYFSGKVPDTYIHDQNKEVYGCKPEGYVVIPPYSAIPRKVVKLTNGKVEEKYWKDYKSIAMDWGNAMSKYKKLKKEYEALTGRKMKLIEFFVAPLYQIGKEQLKQLQLKNAYRDVIRQYARIQIADLYAHFSPVELIHDPDILNSDSFDDGLGKTSIWDRIKKMGEGKFYRVNYPKNTDGNDIEDSEEKRLKTKQYIEGKLKNRQIETKIANNFYVQSVIDGYVRGDTEAIANLYKEPIRSDSEQRLIDELIKEFGETKDLRELDNQKLKEELFLQNQIKQDNTRVVIPTPIPKK